MEDAREFSAAWWRRRASTAVILAVLLALVGGVAPAVAAPAPVLTQQSQDPPPADPVDEEHEFYKQLVQDIAEHAEDVEVREAAAAALAVGTKERLLWFLDHGEAEARAKADERKRVEAAQNRAKVVEWARTGGPNVKAGAEAALNAGDRAIRDFVAYGYEIALKRDKQQAEDDKAEQDRIIARVKMMVEMGGPQVKIEGTPLLLRGDYALIREFYLTGYHVANQRDHDFQAVIEQALIDRNKAITDLEAVARRAEKAANARAEILRANIDAVKNLDDVTLALNLAARAAHKADEIHRDDKPGRVHGQRGRAAEIDALRAEATDWSNRAARIALESAGTTARAQSAGVQLIETGMTNGADWAKVTIAIGAAVEAAARAAETSQHAAEATLADSRALDANAGAQEHAENAKKYRQEAERGAEQAAALATAARVQLGIATTARDKAAEQKRVAEAASTKARQHAVNARNQRLAAQSASANAVGRSQAAVAARNDAVKAGVREQETIEAVQRTGRELKTATSVCQGQMTFAEQAEAGLRKAREEAIAAGKNADEATKDIAEAAGRARSEANASAAWASRAQSAAAAAAAEAQKAAKAAQDARAAAHRAEQEAVTARRAADDANRLAMEAANVAVATLAAAEQTQCEAEAAISEANSAVWQSAIADRAAAAAAASASLIIDPARMTDLVARPYAGINADARKALALAAKALLIGEEQSRAAQEKAAEAQKAAQDATLAADRAVAEVKPAYEAAARAARSAQQAAEDAVAATVAANAATQFAAGAHAAANTAAQHSSSARSDAVGAASAAAVATSAAQTAGQAAAAAEQIHQWAINATASIHKFSDEVGTALDQFTDFKKRAEEAQKKITADAQRKQNELNQQFTDGFGKLLQCGISPLAPGCVEMQVRYAELWLDGITGTGDYIAKGINCQGGDQQACRDFEDATRKIGEFAKNAVDGFVEGAKNTWQGIVTLGNCLNVGGQSSVAACAQIIAGLKDVAQNPYKLVHLDVWHDNPGKAFGLSMFDVLANVVTSPLGGNALSGALNVVRNTISRATAIIAKDVGEFGTFLIKVSDNVPNRLPGDFAQVNRLQVAVNNGVAKLTGGFVHLDGRLYKLRDVELVPEGDPSRLDGSVARIEKDPEAAELQITLENGLAKIEGAKFKFEKIEKIEPPTSAKNVKGVDDPVTGVWTAEEFGQPLRLEAGPNKAVNDFLKVAEGVGSRLTPKMKVLATEVRTGRLYGEDQALKSADSLKRKVVGEIEETPDINTILKEINDSVRYTIVLDDASYVDGVKAAIEKMEVLYDKVEVKNFWKKYAEVNAYKGINSTWRDRETGHLFEMQFHTESSLLAKSIEHPWYQLLRVPGLTALEADFARAQSALLFADVKVLPAYMNIPQFKLETGGN
ncbi:hypothetical protein [Lentzea californiensis]|uniref:hypothetical protein n=1 Tax=Lentzea californiensis TaxID=438851 RepID=UPI002164A897|nr:hypothetical protein [Lentzea californiensis]